MTTVPHNAEVEEALIGRLLREPALTGQIVGTLLEPRHFHSAANQLLYGTIVERFFADESVEPLVIAEHNAKRLAKLWQLDERTAIKRVVELPLSPHVGVSAEESAQLVKRDSDYRALLRLSAQIADQVADEKLTPEQIAGVTGQAALEVATQRALTSEIVSFADAGRAFVNETRVAIAAHEQGIDIGAYYGLRAIDDFTNGHRGGELIMAGGEPGVGKSAVWWKAALNFAERQSLVSADQRVGTLIISLEMGPSPSNARFASMLAGLKGTDIRTGRVTTTELGTVIEEWRRRIGWPLWLNYAPTLRASQLRALVTEAIRRHNVGVVVIDHFRMWDLDVRLRNTIDEDEEKVRFLKEQLALSLNVAVICLAHTRKPDPGSNGRPKMSDLRGSYQVAAHSDMVSFIFRPPMYASEADMTSGKVESTDAELIWAKNRQGNPGTSKFYFDAGRMFIVDR